MLIRFSESLQTTLHQAYLSKREGARTDETVLTPKLKKFQLHASTGIDFLRFFTVFFQIKHLKSKIFYL